ncbi:MAG: glycosyltransferase family 2 protein [Planctomycetes bacterium]|nr:glycosyltransferase family 2 protein [Planctomycetota bacterium]
MSVTVVVTNYNGERHLPHCLGALRALRGDVAEVVLVDNASTDGSLELVRRDFPEVRVVEAGGNDGPCVARNLGMREARTEWVLALDNDAVLPPEALEELLTAAEASGAVIAQPRSVLADEPTRVHYDGGAFHYAGLVALRNFYRPLAEAEGAGVVEVDCAISLCLLVRRTKLLELGGYDPRYFILFEDFDLSYRLRARGERIVSVEHVVVQHRAGTPGVSFREGRDYPSTRVFLHSRNRWVLLAKCWSWRALLLGAPGLALYELVGLAFALAKGGLGAWLRGKLAALRLLPGVLRDRRVVQASRVVRDRDLLVPGPITVTPDAVRGAARGVLRVVDGALALWWRLMRPLA